MAPVTPRGTVSKFRKPTIVKDKLNAFCPHSEIHLAGAERGPLSGRTFGAKDLFDIEGHVTGNGNPQWLATHGPAASTAPAVQACLDAGASLVGKTIMDEMAYSMAGENIHYGTPVNSKAPDRIPGGSSSGSAAAVAGGAVDFALGSDTGGSVRVPASHCGISGMRPTHGWISLDGVVPLASSFDTVGWFARDAQMLSDVGRVLLPGFTKTNVPVRALIAEDAFALADPDAREELRRQAARIAEIVGSSAPVEIQENGLQSLIPVFRTIQAYEAWAAHGKWISDTRPAFGPGIKQRFEFAATVTKDEAEAAGRERQEAGARITSLVPPGTVLVLPAAPGAAPLRNRPPESVESYRNRALALTCPAGLAGLPQVTLAIGGGGGAPVGVSVIAGPRCDESLLALACAI